MKFEIDAFHFQHKPRVKNLVLFLFCFAVIFGPAFALFDSYNYDTTANPDIETYLGLANFDFDQSPVRKYRIIIPFLAAGIHSVFGGLFAGIAPNSFAGPDFAMCLSFLVVNCVFMSIFGVVVYRLCQAFGASRLAAIIGLLSVLTCRWTSYFAGLPIVDSLYVVVIALVLLGIKTKDSRPIIWAIFIGPWAKESFVFIAPLIFFFSPVSKRKQVLLFAVSALLVFVFRYCFDQYSHVETGLGLKSDLDHLHNIPTSLTRLFSFHGLYEIISITGAWGFLFVFLVDKKVRTRLKQKTTLYMVLFLFVVLIHALLSVELARMFYLATPVIAVWLALIADAILPKISGKQQDASLSDNTQSESQGASG